MSIRLHSFKTTTSERGGRKVYSTADGSAKLLSLKSNSDSLQIKGDKLLISGAQELHATNTGSVYSVEHNSANALNSADQQTISMTLFKDSVIFMGTVRGLRLQVYLRSDAQGDYVYFQYGRINKDNALQTGDLYSYKWLDVATGIGNTSRHSFQVRLAGKDVHKQVHVALSIDYAAKALKFYVNGKHVAGQDQDFDGDAVITAKDKPASSPNSVATLVLEGAGLIHIPGVGYRSIGASISNFALHDRILTEAQIQELLINPSMLAQLSTSTGFLGFANKADNDLKASGATVSDFDDIDLEKFIKKDFTSASAVAALDTDGISDQKKVLSIARGLQRLLLTGLAIGPDTNGNINYGNRLQLKEALYLLSANCYSASVLAKVKPEDVTAILAAYSVAFRGISGSDSDEVERAKHRANNRAKLLVASARQRAHLVSLAYMNAKNLTSPALAAANRGSESELSFENQFNSSQYYEVPEHRSVYSLSAYLIALKELMGEHVSEPASASNQRLSQRRPDIESLLLTADNALKLQPKLNIVNKVLRFHARPNTDSKAVLTDKQQDSTQFPLLFPFNTAFEKVVTCLESVESSPYKIARVLGKTTSQPQDVGISPSMLSKIATDPAYGTDVPNFPDSNDTHTLWGYAAANELDGSSEADDKPEALKKVPEFARRAEIAESELHALFFADLSVAEIAADKHLQLYFNSPATGHTLNAQNSLRLSADASEILGLDSLRQDRLHRFLRMSKASGLGFVTLHRLLRGTGNRLNSEFMRIAAAYKRLHEQFDTTVDEFLSLIANIRDVGKGNAALEVPTPLHSIFQRNGQTIELFQSNGQLADLTWQRDGSAPSMAIRAELSARLAITETELMTISRQVKTSGVLTLDKANLSALFRLTYLMRKLNVSANDMQKMLLAIPVSGQMAALVAAEMSPVNKLNAIERLVAYVDDFKQVSYSFVKAYEQGRTDNKLSVKKEKLDNFYDNIRRARENAPAETQASFNMKLVAAKAQDLTLTPAQFSEIFDSDGLVNQPDAAILTREQSGSHVLGGSLSATERNKQVTAFRKVLEQVNNDQITLFENTLLSEFKVNPKYYREFSSWAGMILSEPATTAATRSANGLAAATKSADAPSLSNRLEGRNNDLRERLLDTSTHLMVRKREYQTLRQLANLFKELQLSEADLRTLLTRPYILSGFSVERLPAVDEILGLKRYQLAVKDIDNSNSPIFDIASSRDTTVTDSANLRAQIVAEIVAEYEGAEASEIMPFVDHFMQGHSGRPVYLTLNGLADIVLAYKYSESSRIQPQCMLDILALGSSNRNSYDEIQPLASALEGSLSTDQQRSEEHEAEALEKQRDRLLSLALYRMRSRDLPVDNANAMYRYLLLDVFVGGEAKTSPVKEASCALQLFGDALMNNQEQGHSVNDTFRQYWRWMQNFTTWQANRRTFFETENFLLPEVRKDKSEAFKMLESKINMALNDPKEADNVFKSFARELLATMDLQNVGVALSASAMEPDAIVARTKEGDNRDIYIRFTNLTESEDNPVPYLGGEWQKLPIAITAEDSVSISPVFDQGRWHLFWVSYQQSGQSPMPQNLPLYKAQLNQLSQKVDGGWEAPRIIREREVSRGAGNKRNDFSHRFVSAYPAGSFRLRGTVALLKKVWDRMRNIEGALASGDSPVKVLVEQMGIKATDNTTKLTVRDLVNQQIDWTNTATSRTERRADEPYYDEYHYEYRGESLLRDEINAANSNATRTPVDGIVLSLPPVFGFFSGESIRVRDYENRVNNSNDTIKQPSNIASAATVRYFCIGHRFTDNENYINGNRENVDTLIIMPDGEQRIASAMTMEYTRSIKPRKLRADGQSQESTYNYNSQADLRALSGYPVNNGSTTIQLITANNNSFNIERSFLTAGTTLYQMFYGTVSGQEYLLDKDSLKFIRTSSQAGRDLLQRLHRFGIDKFMHYDSQRQPEAPFNVSNPHVKVAYPRPSERISFSDFNGRAYRELFFHAPMLIATALKNAEQYDAADRWYRYVYNPQADGKNLSLATKSDKRFHDTSALRNNFWQSLYLRETAASEFVCDAYKFTASDRSAFQGDLIEFFKNRIDRQTEPYVVFKAPSLNYKKQGADDFNQWIVNGSGQPLSKLITKQADNFNASTKIDDVLMRYRGSQYLTKGAYYLQFVIDNGFAAFCNGELLFSQDGATPPRIINVLLNVEESGIQYFEFLYQQGTGGADFSVKIAAAQPGLELVRDRLTSDNNAKAAKLEDSIDYQVLGSQAVFEQRLLNEVNGVDDLAARQTYIRDPFNPHALAAVRPSAYKTWAFYEFLDNQIKRGDKLFRKLTREDLAEAALVYTQVQDLLGDKPVSVGELDALPAASSVEKVRKAGLLDFDGDGDVDLDDADIQAKRLVDATSGRLQSALELILEQRLTNVTRNASTSMLVTEAYTGNDGSALQTQPREVKLNDDGTKVMLAPITGAPTFTPQNYLNNSYFAIPVNKRTTQLWDILSSRLFNLRNGRDINGKRINLALTQPALDPLALAKRNGSDGTLGQLRGNSDMAIPHYRFSYAINRAKEVAQMVSGFGSRLLTIMEKQDATELEALRASHEQQILEMSSEVVRHQVMSVERNLEIFYRQYETARYLEYKNTGAQNINTTGLSDTNGNYQSLSRTPIVLDKANDTAAIAGVRGDRGELYPANQLENTTITINNIKQAIETIAGTIDGIGTAVKTAPNVFGLAVGGQDYGAIVRGVAKVLNATGVKILGQIAGLTGDLASRQRRKSGWEENRQIAIMDQAELKDKIVQGMHDLNAVMTQFTNLQREIESGQEIEQFIKSERRTRTELYRWLSNRMSGLYFQAYQLALSMAKEAEQAFNFELGLNKAFIRGDYWDNTQQGLLAGDGLLLSLQRMQQAFEQDNKRRLEITKPISLKHNPYVWSAEDNFNAQESGANKGTNLIQLLKAKPKNNRKIEFELPSKLFARDYPSHYMRLIKGVSITIPAVVGPYETISATLKQLNSKVLLENNKTSAKALVQDPNAVPEGVRTDFRSNQSIAVSGAVNDSGLFQLNFGDSRLLPFENTGVHSKWELEFSSGISDEVFSSITDIIIEVKYVAEEGSDELKSEVLSAF